MAAILTEFFVSIDGSEFVKLDLHKDESFNLKSKQKDLQDLSKIFAPFSQPFQFPATPKNRAAFGFYGDTDAVKINTSRKFECKIYLGGILKETGFIKLEKLSYKNGKARDFTGHFASNMTNLKDKIGDDTLQDIADEPVLVEWDYQGVQNMITSQQTQIVDGITVKSFTPLISLTRVWAYDATHNPDILDNIAYSPSTRFIGENLIKPYELRPSIFYSTILDFIKKKYDLDIVSPLESRPEYTDLAVWCNSEKMTKFEYKRVPIINDFGPRRILSSANETHIQANKKYSVTTDLVNDTINIYKDPTETSSDWVNKGVSFSVRFDAVVITGITSEPPSVNVRYVRASDDVILAESNHELTFNYFECSTELSDQLWDGGNNLEFYIEVQFNQPTSWSNCRIAFFWLYRNTDIFNYINPGNGRPTVIFLREAWYYHTSAINDNNNLINADQIDIIKSLPDTKVIDFLASHFKLFNISVFDTSPDNSSLYWLTPEDIASVNNVYSAAEVDYTPYVDFKSVIKETPNDYNYYNFKHADSEYFSNLRYKDAFDLDYGQTVYPAVKPLKPSEFKVETAFSIVPPIDVPGTAGLTTIYGFNGSDPEILDTGESRYTPNYDELTLFYFNGPTTCNPLALRGIKTTQRANGTYFSAPGVHTLTAYLKVTPVNNFGYSLAFSVLNINGSTYQNSLYLRYYSAQTERLLDPNALAQTFDLILPPSEIYINESSVSGGAGVPSGFRLQNNVIIGENKFTIIDSLIDITTGKSKIKFLNY